MGLGHPRLPFRHAPKEKLPLCRVFRVTQRRSTAFTPPGQRLAGDPTNEGRVVPGSVTTGATPVPQDPQDHLGDVRRKGA